MLDHRLGIVTPTRRRWAWMKAQAKALAPQMAPDDLWVIVVDNDSPDMEACEQINQIIGLERIVWIQLGYQREVPPRACVNRAHNIGVAMLPAEYRYIAEVDDHDTVTPDCLGLIRQAFATGAEYCFGDFHRQAVIDIPTGQRILEPWPDLHHVYVSESFRFGTIEAIGVRAFTRDVWDQVGGWSQDTWPCADYEFARQVERLRKRIFCIAQPLCTVTIEPDSLSATYRQSARAQEAVPA